MPPLFPFPLNTWPRCRFAMHPLTHRVSGQTCENTDALSSRLRCRQLRSLASDGISGQQPVKLAVASLPSRSHLIRGSHVMYSPRPNPTYSQAFALPGLVRPTVRPTQTPRLGSGCVSMIARSDQDNRPPTKNWRFDSQLRTPGPALLAANCACRDGRRCCCIATWRS